MIKHLKVLVVDDDPIIVSLLDTYLASTGYDVSVSLNPLKALEEVRRTHFDMLVSDIDMAGMNGFQLLENARTEKPRIGVILMTGYDEAYPRVQAIQAGADGYVVKPFSLRKFAVIFERAYWNSLCRQDVWEEHDEHAGPTQSAAHVTTPRAR